MFEKIANDDDRGQVGIGTLIVFIAMVLVAAIAAGVLINTAGFLQSSAEETGQQSSSQVTDRLQVVGTVGTSIDDTPAVGTVQVTVKQAPGADSIDLETTIAQWVDNSGAYDVTYGTDAAGDGTNFTVATVQDDDNSITESNVLNDPADRAVLTFDAAALSTPGINEGETVTVRLNTQSGGTTTVTITAPETLSGKSAVTL